MASSHPPSRAKKPIARNLLGLGLAPIVMVVFVFSVGLVGCGKSPIFNHRMEEEPQNKPQAPKPSDQNVMTYSALGLKAKYRWVVGPQTPDESKLELEFTDLNGQSVSLEGLEVELWMPDMGHGSAPTSWELQADGKILVQEIYFIMGGFWEVRVRPQFNSKVEQLILRVDL